MMSPHLGWFMFPFIKIKSHIKRKASDAYLHPNWRPNFHGSDKMKQSEKRHYQMVTIRELLSCVRFSLLSS